MRRNAKYLEAVAWIAHNDAPGDDTGDDTEDTARIASFLTTCLVADLFAAGDNDAVARDVVTARKAIARDEREVCRD